MHKLGCAAQKCDFACAVNYLGNVLRYFKGCHSEPVEESGWGMSHKIYLSAMKFRILRLRSAFSLTTLCENFCLTAKIFYKPSGIRPRAE